MKKFKKIVAVLALSVLMLMCVCACDKKDGDSKKQGDVLEGTWGFSSADYGDVTVTFDGNGKMNWGYAFDDFAYDDDGTYQIQDGGKITIKLNGWDNEQSGTYTIDGNTLTITDCGGVAGTYTKK